MPDVAARAATQDRNKKGPVIKQVLFYGPEGETRTRTPLRILDFESSASTIPPLRVIETK